MANNLSIGPNASVALASADGVSFTTAGFTETNCTIIYEVGNPNKSWKPERDVNSITGFTGEKGYYIVMKQAADKTAYLVPPISGNGGGNGNTTPPAPTSLVINDAWNTAAWTNASGFESPSDYEYSTNYTAGTPTWTTATFNPVNVTNISIASGAFAVRVKAAAGRNASPALVSTTAFTVTAAGTLIWEDTFTGSDSTDLSGRVVTTGGLTWAKESGNTGTAGITSNAAEMKTVGDVTYFINAPYQRNVDLRVTLGLKDTTQTYRYGWQKYAYVNAQNHFATNMETGQTFAMINGTPETLYEGDGGSSIEGDVIRIVLIGTDLKVYRNTTLLTTEVVSASALAGTAQGILFTNDPNSRIDKIGAYTV